MPKTIHLKITFQVDLNQNTRDFLSNLAVTFDTDLANALKILFEPVYGQQLTKLEHGKITSLNIGGLSFVADQILVDNKINSINLDSVDISDLKDLKEFYFIADKTGKQFINYTFENSPILEKIVFQHHNVKSINLTKNVNVTDLDCSSNELTELDLTKNIQLQKLNCQFNQINNLNLSENSSLEHLNIRFLPICGTKIIFPNQNNIQQLYIDGTKIEKIDFSKFINLQKLQVGSEIQAVDVTECKFLKSIRLVNSTLDNLDISINSSLTEFSIYESKIDRLTCNELQSFIIPSFSKRLKHKPNTEQKEIIKTHELHNKAITHNWDDGLDRLKKILKDPNCDIATATAIFWLGQPNFFLQYQNASEVPGHAKEQFNFLKNLEHRLLDNDFSKNIIPFNPKTYANYNWTVDSFNPATAKRELDEKLKLEIIGQTSTQFDFNRKYNLKIS